MYRYNKLLTISATLVVLSVMPYHQINAIPVPVPEPCKELEKLVAPTMDKIVKDAPTDILALPTKLFSLDRTSKDTKPVETTVPPTDSKPTVPKEDAMKDFLRQLIELFLY